MILGGIWPIFLFSCEFLDLEIIRFVLSKNDTDSGTLCLVVIELQDWACAFDFTHGTDGVSPQSDKALQ